MSLVPRITIKLLSGGMAGLIKEFEADDSVLIGRDADAQVRLHPTEDKTVGRKHARLFCHEGHWRIEAIHHHGVLVQGQPIGSMAKIQDGSVYMLGNKGPEFRVSLMDDDAPVTVLESMGDENRGMLRRDRRRRESRRVQRRVEFDPAEIEASARRQSGRTLRIVIPTFVAVIALAGLCFYWFVDRNNAGNTSGADIRRRCAESVFRAAGTVRFRCPAPDVRQDSWTRYWVTHGTSFAVAVRDGWVYGLTNHHVFGESARPVLSTKTRRQHLARAGILERWPRDWPSLAKNLDAFGRKLRSLSMTDVSGRDEIKLERFDYLEPILKQCEFDLDDPAWRQVVVDGNFVPAEVVESSEELDLVLFRFRQPDREVRPLPLRDILNTEHGDLTGGSVYILGFPGAGDLPLKRFLDALQSTPDIAPGVLSNIKHDDRHKGYSIQVTAPINEGNSGGPLFDPYGNVIGINTFGPSKAETEGVSYALALGRALEMLKRHGVQYPKPSFQD